MSSETGENDEKTSMAKRIRMIRLVIQGYLGIKVAQSLNLHREAVSIYAKKLNQGVILVA